MRGRLQQGCGQLVKHAHWLLAAFATAVYLITMDRSVSWWDCGEFISTGWLLQVGHPPGAPVYQLLSHLFMLLSFGNAALVAPLGNALSAVAAGITVGVLYLTVLELAPGHRLGAAVGALCYLFCDTVWFSAVESEVYALAMLFCSLDVYLALRFARTGNGRLLLLLGLLLGLGVCVHLMTLLVLPAVALVVLGSPGVLKSLWTLRSLRTLAFAFLFFVVGLTPYLIVPIRAAANPPINEMGSSFESYIKREQYAKAPLYPRMWRERDARNWQQWTPRTDGVVGNVVYYVGYQLGYMYGRYLMYNFAGRENLKWRCVVLFVLPALLGCYGLWRHRRRNRQGYWVVMLLFLMGGVVLNLYLNHPCYEPRERDYAYVLSFYAFAVWIGVGAAEMNQRWKLSYLLFLAPLALAVGNWSDHDRSGQHAVRDIATAHLESCDQGAILITLGDNDTFPLWYMQQVEHKRTDIDIYNLGLTGYGRVSQIIDQNLGSRPVYVTQYFYDRYGSLFVDRLRCEGLCWRLLPTADGVDDREPLERHVGQIEWHITPHEYRDRVTQGFLRSWQQNTGRTVVGR